MTDSKKPEPSRNEKGQFVLGGIGIGGRPKGARAALGEAFLEDLKASWEANGPSVIHRVIEERPQDYLKVVASLLPKDVNLNFNPTDDMTDDQLIERIRRLDAAIRPFLDAEGAGEAGRGVGPSATH